MRAQAEGFAEWEAALRKEMGAAVERLRSYEVFLGQVRWQAYNLLLIISWWL